MSVFYKHYLALCAEKKVSPSGAAKAIGLSNAAASGWKKEKVPSDVTLEKLANYFGVPVSRFFDEQDVLFFPCCITKVSCYQVAIFTRFLLCFCVQFPLEVPHENTKSNAAALRQLER